MEVMDAISEIKEVLNYYNIPILPEYIENIGTKKEQIYKIPVCWFNMNKDIKVDIYAKIICDSSVSEYTFEFEEIVIINNEIEKIFKSPLPYNVGFRAYVYKISIELKKFYEYIIKNENHLKELKEFVIKNWY